MRPLQNTNQPPKLIPVKKNYQGAPLLNTVNTFRVYIMENARFKKHNQSTIRPLCGLRVARIKYCPSANWMYI